MSQPTQFLYPSQWVDSGSTPRYETTLTDVDGTTAILPVQLVTLTLTIYDLTGGENQVVNDVHEVNILNADRGTVDSEGLLTIQLEAGDTEILDATHAYEIRRLLIRWTFGASGIYAGSHEVDLAIRHVFIPPEP